MALFKGINTDINNQDPDMKFLVDFVNSASPADIDQYLQQHGCTVVKEWNHFDKIFLVEAASEPPKTEITDRVCPEQTLTLTPLDINPYFCTHRDPAKPDITVAVNQDRDWWKNFTRANPEFDNSTTTIKRRGQGINVYVMDSGIEAGHPEFAGADITNIYSVTPGDYSDRKGHGTAIASVIVGATCGVTAAKLKVVKIFDPGHVTTEHEFLDAIDAIISDHAENTFSVLNASWSIAKNDWVEHKLRVLEDRGVFLIVAAGNNGSSIDNVTPASMIDAITVGAYNQNLVPCDFSNYTGGSIISVTGSTINLGELDGWAPGEMIWAAGLNGSYGYVAGTSIAAAIASAVAASNLSCWVDESTSQRILGFESATISSALPGSNLFIFKRVNLLDLSNSEYRYCVNLIATFADRDNYPVNQTPDELSACYRIGRGLQGVRLYENKFTQSIRMIDPLPANFAILPDGRLYGHPDISQGPVNGAPYSTYVSRFMRTNTDGTEELVTVNIYVLPENLAPETLPSDDPVVIVFAGTCSGLSVPACQSGVGGCTDFCNFDQSCCDGPSKGTLECQCQG